MVTIRSIVLFLCIAALSGCSTLQTGERDILLTAATQSATVHYLDARSNPSESAKRVIEITDVALALIGDGTVTVLDQLEIVVREQAKFNELAPSDQILANALIAAVRLRMEEAIGNPELAGGRLVGVRFVLEDVRAAALMYRGS